MKIGNITLKYGLALAPMAGATDYTFRKICKQYGAEYTVSEMVSAKAMHYKDKKTATLARIRKGESPMAIQIFGSEPEIMAEAAGALCDGSYYMCQSEEPPAAIDINAGCPVKKITSNGEGSALMKNPTLLHDIVLAVKRSSSVPVTVKIRAGWDKSSVNAVECALAAESAGADMICVHGRTKDQLYAPGIDLDIIARVKEAVRIPVMGNGGIYSAEDAVKMLEYTTCDGLMLAQGALGNPFLFEEIISLLKGENKREIPIEERVRVMKTHLDMLIADKGEIIGVCEARKHLGWYSDGVRGSALFRSQINSAKTKDEMLLLIDGLFTVEE